MICSFGLGVLFPSQRLALLASNVAVGSVINLDFPIIYVVNGNKELILSYLPNL